MLVLEPSSRLNSNSHYSDSVTSAFIERNDLVVFIWVSCKGLSILLGTSTMCFLCQPYHTKSKEHVSKDSLNTRPFRHGAHPRYPQSFEIFNLFFGKVRQFGQSHSPLGSSVTPTHL